MTRAEFLCLTEGTKVKVDGRMGVVRTVDKRGSDLDCRVEFGNGDQQWIHYTLVELLDIRTSDPIRPAEALRAINNYRDRKAQRKLDPREAQWTNDDLIEEYNRLVSIREIWSA